MGLCEELGIERDDYSEDISDDEWARRWEARYQEQRAKMTGLQKMSERLGRGGTEMLLQAIEHATRDAPGLGIRLLQAIDKNYRDLP